MAWLSISPTAVAASWSARSSNAPRPASTALLPASRNAQASICTLSDVRGQIQYDSEQTTVRSERSTTRL